MKTCLGVKSPYRSSSANTSIYRLCGWGIFFLCQKIGETFEKSTGFFRQTCVYQAGLSFAKFLAGKPFNIIHGSRGIEGFNGRVHRSSIGFVVT